MTHPITEALLAAMMPGVQPMVLTDPSAADHPMIAVNSAFSRLTGYQEADSVGRNCRFLQGADTGPEGPARIRRALAERRGCVEWLVNYRADGSRFWNLLFISPIFDPSGRLLHFFGNQRDITFGKPAELPDYVLGKSDLTNQARAGLDALLQEIMTEMQGARSPETITGAARRLDTLTLDLTPAPWTF